MFASIAHARSGSKRGFTLIELLVSLAIIATLLSLVAPRYFGGVTKAEEAVLKENLSVIRDALDKHYADNGKYPEALDDLVKKKYLRNLPVDPIAQNATAWVLVPPADSKQGSVYDVRSGAPGTAKDGTAYAQW